MNEVEKATERCATLMQTLRVLVDLGRVLELLSYLLNAVQMWSCIILHRVRKSQPGCWRHILGRSSRKGKM